MYQNNLNNRSLRRTLLLGAASVAAISLSAPALAQDQGPVETVVVTGSHIPTTNLTTTSPVTEISSEDIHTQGVTRIEDLVNQLPQAFAAQNSTVSNGATGTATVNLRGLGSSRTLVLIDGQRLPYGSPLASAADLNEVPTQMVDRVEVLTGGASAVYGSDAIAGVVNFIMKKDFEGFQIDAQYDAYQHNNSYDGVGALRETIAGRAATNPAQFKLPDDSVWDGEGKTISGMLGVSSADGKGNVTAYFSYRNNQPILESQRDYSSCSLGGGFNAANKNGAGQTVPGRAAGVDFTCGGSSTSYPGRFTDFSTFNFTLNPSTSAFTAFNSSLNQYNYGPLNYYQRPDERYSLGAFGHYKVNSHVEVYTQLMFTDYNTTGQIAPSGDFGNTGSINCGNPLLGATKAAAIHCSPADIAADNSVPMYILRRNVEGGGRQDSLRYQSYRAVFGVKGEITNGWDYDLNGQYSRVQLSRVYKNDFSVTRLTRALHVVDVGGVPTCQSVVNGTDPNCVPYDVFHIGGVTQAALDYLQIPLMQQGSTDLQVLTGVVNGDLSTIGLVSPFAKSPFQLAVGVEYRSNGLDTTTDTSFSTGDGAGQGGPTIGLSGRTSVVDGFGEIKAPLVEDAPLAKLISLDLAYRYSSYDSGVVTNTYKIAGDWAPVDDFRLRASFQHAVRAANVIELFSAQGLGLFDMAGGDPCGTAMTATLAQCVATGVPAAQYGSGALDSPASQYNLLGGGNPNLKPEKSDTWTVGTVLTPTFLDGFTASIDYFDIKVQDLVSSTGSLNILAACYNSGIAAECARIHRNALGQLWLGTGYVEDLNTNIGGLKTAGVDVNAFYQMDLADVGIDQMGSLSFNLIGTWLDKYIVDTGVIGQATYNCAGMYGNQCSAGNGTPGVPSPKWRHRFRVSWQMPWDDISVSATWRMMTSVKTFQGTTTAIDYTLDAQHYFDLAANIPLMNSTTLRLGVNNVLDRDPPITRVVGTTGNGNTYPQTYDALGRYMFAGIQINL